MKNNKKKKKKKKTRKKNKKKQNTGKKTMTATKLYITKMNKYLNLTDWRLGGQSNREIVSFRSCVRAGEARRSCEGEREAVCSV